MQKEEEQDKNQTSMEIHYIFLLNSRWREWPSVDREGNNRDEMNVSQKHTQLCIVTVTKLYPQSMLHTGQSTVLKYKSDCIILPLFLKPSSGSLLQLDKIQTPFYLVSFSNSILCLFQPPGCLLECFWLRVIEN